MLRDMTTVRRATVQDADAIAAVHMRTWQAAYRGLMPDAFLDQLDVPARAERWQRNLSSDDGHHLVTEDARGQINGFCSLLPTSGPDYPPNGGIIAALYIDPSAWRTGLGAALMHTATVRARERGFDALWLWVLEGNHNARRFYESLGFTADGADKSDEYGAVTLRGLRYRAPLG
jgi:ribosomal protein S18 acetylase RimI-like enzyme